MLGTSYVFRYQLDERPTGGDFLGPFGATRKQIRSALLPYKREWPCLRYTRGKHDSLDHVIDVCQIRDLVSLTGDRSLAEHWAREVDHEDVSGEIITFMGAGIDEIVLADVVLVAAAYRFEISQKPYYFRVQNFIFPSDARFDLVRLHELGNPDQVSRDELSSIHAALVFEAEDWS